MHYSHLIIVNLLLNSTPKEIWHKLVNNSDRYRPADNDSSYWLDSQVAENDDFHKLKRDLDEYVCLIALWKTKKSLSEIAIGEGQFEQTDGGLYLLTKNVITISQGTTLNDLNDYLFLTPQGQEIGRGFIRIEESESLVNKVAFYLPQRAPSTGERAGSSHEAVPSPQIPKSSYAQQNEHIQRQYAERAAPFSQLLDQGFELDFNRISSSKAFRRLVDKAQVFSSAKGDHYRTRMTHTQEVVRIARAIATGLGANITLTETIAMAHDIGHTPFGHQGERTLDKMLRDKLCVNIDQQKESEGDDQNRRAICRVLHAFGGFKHNLQSVRVLTALERTSPEYDGLNLSWQVVEGALWHTKVPLMADCESCTRLSNDLDCTCCSIEFFINRNRSSQNDCEFENKVFHNENYQSDGQCSLTLEGQIVALADEIAQRGHDIDDALAAGLISITELTDLLNTHFGKELMDALRQEDKLCEKSLASNRVFISDIEAVRRIRTVQTIIDYFVNDAIVESKKGLELEGGAAPAQWDNGLHIFRDEVVKLSPSAKLLTEFLESTVNRRVITSSEVAAFDSNAERVVASLFTRYLENPKLLPKATLRRLALLERYNFGFLNEKWNFAFDLSDCTIGALNDEIKRMRDANVDTTILREDSSINLRDRDKGENDSYKFKKVLLARTVTDYISGMTDSYALREYKRLCI